MSLMSHSSKALIDAHGERQVKSWELLDRLREGYWKKIEGETRILIAVAAQSLRNKNILKRP